MSAKEKRTPESIVREIRRKTRRKFTDGSPWYTPLRRGVRCTLSVSPVYLHNYTLEVANEKSYDRVLQSHW